MLKDKPTTQTLINDEQNFIVRIHCLQLYFHNNYCRMLTRVFRKLQGYEITTTKPRDARCLRFHFLIKCQGVLWPEARKDSRFCLEEKRL